MLHPFKSGLAILALAAALGAEDVLVPADPAKDPKDPEVLIKDEKFERKTPVRKTTVRKVVSAKPVAADPKVQVNNINIHGPKGSNADSLAAKARRDSLALTEKARQDSLALAAKLSESERSLALERSKRNEMETQLLTTGLLVLDAVYFETAKTDISINSKPYLDMLAKMLTKYPKLQLEVAGHTDHVGGDAYNLELSRGRSAAVMTYLIGREPGLNGRLTSQGYGESRPKADNSTAEGRMHNRRTELKVVNKEALDEYRTPSEQARGPEPRTY